MFLNTLKSKCNYKSFNHLQQHFTKWSSIHIRSPKAISSKKQYQEMSEVENTKEFPYNSICNPINSATEKEKQELMSVWPEVMEAFVNSCTDIPKLKEHLTTLLHEHVYKHKQTPGILVPAIYKAMEAPEKVSTEKIKLANILGNCVDMYQTVLLIMDDVVDSGELRFGKPCWYRREDIGMNAVTDTVILENGIHTILRKYLSGLSCYLPVVELYRDVCLKCVIGMHLDDTAYEITGKQSIESFTTEIYAKIAKYKGSLPTYNLPVSFGMYLIEKYDSKAFRLVNNFATELGIYFIAQNDFLDYAANPATTGKITSDISLGKCTWLIVEALKRANPAQKEILSKHYGRGGQESELEVRNVYDNLGMLSEFLLYEEESFSRACQSIQLLPEDVNKQAFFKIAEAMYNRKYEEN